MDADLDSRKKISSRYDFRICEAKWMERWLEHDSFVHPVAGKKHLPFTIMIPPPNVTGELHVGHALNQTIQDFLIRYARKKGLSALWQSGVDHAGIATQTRVEAELAKKKQRRMDLGRERFLEAVWSWKERSGDQIAAQQRRMGFSFDDRRKRFTMDPSYSKSVIHAFVSLYKKKLIYRAKKIVHWDPGSQTVLSDLEVEHEENFAGKLVSFGYSLVPISDAEKSSTASKTKVPSSTTQAPQEIQEIVVATTRPETMLGDTAIAVHPHDDRYRHLHGRYVMHPFLERHIPIIPDAELVDPKFGTGAVKVTPAHDPNDFTCGQRHNLPMINIMDAHACLNENAGSFAGLERYVARKEVIQALEKKGLLRGIRDYSMSLARSQRTGVVVEPILSTQWFLQVEPLAKPALRALKDKKFFIYPRQYEATYRNWLTNIHDWCISRQLWWGHRIPVWYGPDGHAFCEETEEEAMNSAQVYYGKDGHVLNGEIELRQEDDVLDTWFSSALWPFASLGWPKKNADLEQHYPGTILVTAHDIIFFWVARMVMMGMHFMKQIPFQTVYIHGLLRDEKGFKMSKTRGNVVDPVATIEKYGTDAFRFFLLATINEGKDSLYSEQRLKGYYHLTNKIWNSARFLLLHRENLECHSYGNHLDKVDVLFEDQIQDQHYMMEDIWILRRMSLCIAEVDRSIASLKYHLIAQRIYEFVWNEYCDWYLEMIKSRLMPLSSETSRHLSKNSESISEQSSAHRALQTAGFVFDKILDLLHPIMPFLTEELAELCNPAVTKEKNNGSLGATDSRSDSAPIVVGRSWPNLIKIPKHLQKLHAEMEIFQEIVQTVRRLRKTLALLEKQTVDMEIHIVYPRREMAKMVEQNCQQYQLVLRRLIRVEKIRVMTMIKEAKKKKEGELRKNSQRLENRVSFSLGVIIVQVSPLDADSGNLNQGKVDIALLRLQKEKLEVRVEQLKRKLGDEKFLQRAPKKIVKREKDKYAQGKEKCIVLQEQIQQLEQTGSSKA